MAACPLLFAGRAIAPTVVPSLSRRLSKCGIYTQTKQGLTFFPESGKAGSGVNTIFFRLGGVRRSMTGKGTAEPQTQKGRISSRNPPLMSDNFIRAYGSDFNVTGPSRPETGGSAAWPNMPRAEVGTFSTF